jgi:23S rRNA G2069 N7-methylase RlmK/C1962 C5-methylase RlmI
MPLARPATCDLAHGAMLASLARRAPARAAARAARRGGGGGGASSSAAAAAVAAPASAAADSALPRVILKGGKTKLFTEQLNPVVYAGAVDRVVGRPPPGVGAPVLVQNGAQETLAWGVFNPDSMYRVRILETADEAAPGAELDPNPARVVAERLAAAVALRRTLGLPAADTTAYRLVNAEGDRLSGLVVDALGDALVASSSAAWVEQRRGEVVAALKAATGAARVVWRPATEMLAQEGWAVEAAATEEAEAVASASAAEDGAAAAEGADEVVVLERGLKFLVDTTTGQKTGFYADQRESRAFVRSLAAGARVLDLCCYTGGFAVAAAAGGAAAALGVDSSAPALALAARNAALNGVADRADFERADVAAFMRAAAAEGREWDLVVLDPPKLAPNKKALAAALRKYGSLNAAAMRLVRPGGLLMTCSCSGAVTQAGAFAPMLAAAARRAGRRLALVRAAGAAPCHALDLAYPEGEYLTNFTVRVA